jgi:predicted N-formylglutamate amidohydrolase
LLLAENDPPPFEEIRPDGASRVVLLCDHASRRLPRALGDLGLSEADRASHIGWDIGAAHLARTLSALLDAPLVLAGYSRLAIDCNRPPGVPTSIPEMTCGTRVPGNEGLSPEARAARENELFWPYHRALERIFAAREQRRIRSIVLSVHSFTPSMGDAPRPWHAGMVYRHDARLAQVLLRELSRDPALVLGDNEPYQVGDLTDYGVPVYGERPNRPSVLLEVRQDLIAMPEGGERWAARLATALRPALDEL